MRRMTEQEWHAFVMESTRTAKVATTRKDGRPHVVPVWFVLDGEDIVFTTGASSIKGQALRRDLYACLCVDDQAPPFSFVMVEGPVELSTDLDELRRVATRIGRRYMGAERAEEFGARNAAEGELLVRLRPTHVLAEADLARTNATSLLRFLQSSSQHLSRCAAVSRGRSTLGRPPAACRGTPPTPALGGLDVHLRVW
jgi:PPOX class probable F420-dependent enzyme